MSISLEKQERRRQIKLLRKQMDTISYELYSQSLNTNLISYIKQCNPKAIKGFIPYAKEPNIWPFIHYCWQHNISYIVPKCEQQTATMRWYEIIHEQQLIKGAYSILEPDTQQCIEKIEEVELVLVPALGFTKAGERLGYGGGYYDRFFEKAEGNVNQWIGIAFNNFIFQELPTEIHDFKCQYIVTDAGVIDCKVEEKEDCNGIYTL